MKGGFYDIRNLAKCNPINFCKDGEDTILNMYNTLLDKVFLEPDRLNVFNIIKTQNAEYESKLALIPEVIRKQNIFNVFNVYTCNVEILDLNKKKLAAEREKKSLELEKGKEKEIKTLVKKIEGCEKGILYQTIEKNKYPNHIKIDELLSDETFMDLLIKNMGQIKILIAGGDVLKKNELIKRDIERFITNHYSNGKWNKKCVDGLELKNLLNSLLTNSYKDIYYVKFNEILETYIKEYMDTLKCIVPYNINGSNNIFEHMVEKDKDYKIYRQFNDKYYEIFSYKAPAAPIVPKHINYLLNDDYTLTKMVIEPAKIIDKLVLYPNYSQINEKYEQSTNLLFFKIYDLTALAFKMNNSTAMLNRFIFGLKISTINKIDVFLNRHLTYTENNMTIYHRYYTLLDVFIVSNEYNMYKKYQLITQLKYSTVYTDEYFEKNKDGTFIDYIKKLIYTDKSINMKKIIELQDKFKDQIRNLNDIYNHLNINLQNKELLISSYNYLFLLNDTIDTLHTKMFILENINRQLKYTREQIFMLICIDLYKEMIENYFLIKSNDTEKDMYLTIYTLLNTIYYNSIYKQDKVKNLINYVLQFNYPNKLVCDLDENLELYNPYQLECHIDDISECKTFYRKLLYDSLDYSPYNYSNYRKDLVKYKSHDVHEKLFNVALCGEILIFNIINLLIYDRRIRDINPDFLPPSTIDSLKTFYRGKTLTLFNNDRNIIINEFVPLLHEIEFVKTIDVKLNVYNHCYIDAEGKMKKGVEIIPTYINVCRILAYLIGHNIYSVEEGVVKINCKFDVMRDIFNKFGGNMQTVLLENFEATPTLDDSTFKMNINVEIKLNKFILKLSSKHGDIEALDNLESYKTLFDNQTLYFYIFSDDITSIFYIFSHLYNKPIMNLTEKMKILKSNSYYKELFLSNKFVNLDKMISYIFNDKENYDDLSSSLNVLNEFKFNSVEDMINKTIKSNNINDIYNLSHCITKIFNILYKYINYDDINIECFEKFLMLKELNNVIYCYFVSPFSGDREPVLKFLLKMSRNTINTVFNILLNMDKESYNGEIGDFGYKTIIELICDYIDNFEPQEFDLDVFDTFIVKNLLLGFTREDIYVKYLATNVSEERQIYIYNKLFFNLDKYDIKHYFRILNFIGTFINIISKLEKTDPKVNFLNSAYDVYLKLLETKNIIIDEEKIDIIIQVTTQYLAIINITLDENVGKISLKEFLEDNRNICLINYIIYANSKNVNKEILEFQKNIIDYFINILKLHSSFTYAEISNIFSLGRSKALLDSFGFILELDGIRYKLRDNYKVIKYANASANASTCRLL